ncbi:MAG TPA: response regulator transcription factor [Ktedonobacteraceae bacterium]|jgi:DNA-binding NarL/FixJ family response regulator|nr:response regulator transcription factor [Ktedonobacteraceae bacterium]
MSAEKQGVRILLADDHDILRQGLKMLLGLQEDVEVIGEARTGREAIHKTRDLSPDVVVMDITMPDIDGLEACKLIRHEHPETQVLILTMHESEEYFLSALRAGAAGYLVKKAAPTELHMAILAVAHGGAFLYPGLAKALVRTFVEGEKATSQSRQESVPELDALTPRELEVLKLVAEGYTNQEIADRLVLSIKTVQAHRANIMTKLGLQDITQLVRFAIRYGLIPPD